MKTSIWSLRINISLLRRLSKNSSYENFINFSTPPPPPCLRRAEKTQFFGQNFQKVSKIFFWPLFSKFRTRRRKFGEHRVFIVICESSEDQFDRPKKKKRSIKFRKFFENATFPPPAPPPTVVEKILVPPPSSRKS